MSEFVYLSVIVAMAIAVLIKKRQKQGSSSTLDAFVIRHRNFSNRFVEHRVGNCDYGGKKL